MEPYLQDKSQRTAAKKRKMCFVVLTKHHRIDTVVMYDIKFQELMKKKNYKHILCSFY